MEEGKSKVLAYRLEDQQDKDLEAAIYHRRLEQTIEMLSEVEANYKTVNILKKHLKVLDRREMINWGQELMKRERPIFKVLGAYLLNKVRYFEIDQEYISELVLEFCHHDDWNVRQAGVDLLVKMVAKTEGHQHELLRELAKSDDPYHRRLVLLTSKEIAKSANYEDELKRGLLDHLEFVLGEVDPYVQTVSSETFKNGYMKYCSDMTINWFETKIEETEDVMIKSNILTYLGTIYVDENIDSVLGIIDDLLQEDNEEIKRARSAALHTLSKRHHDRVSSFLENRLHIHQAVEHWAELEADGTLNSFDF